MWADSFAGRDFREVFFFPSFFSGKILQQIVLFSEFFSGKTGKGQPVEVDHGGQSPPAIFFGHLLLNQGVGGLASE